MSSCCPFSLLSWCMHVNLFIVGFRYPQLYRCAYFIFHFTFFFPTKVKRLYTQQSWELGLLPFFFWGTMGLVDYYPIETN